MYARHALLPSAVLDAIQQAKNNVWNMFPSVPRYNAQPGTEASAVKSNHVKLLEVGGVEEKGAIG